MTEELSNKKIAKNTVFLYIRMIITTIISLYTSRALLQILGVSDYGIYNIVAGSISMFSFIITALSGSAQRFFSVALGKKDIDLYTNTFQVILTLHMIFAAFFFLLMEIIGIYIIDNVLNIPADRIEVAKWIFHFSLLSIIFDLMRSVLDAAIIAYEKMLFYAYISIVESILKLSIVFLLSLFSSFESLKVYAVLYMCSSLVLLVSYYIFTSYRCPGCIYRFKYDKALYKEIGAYLGWNILGNFSFFISTQGINVILNIFLGVRINAARGLSLQVNGIVSKFTSNFQTAAMPQIIKSYSGGDWNYMYNLTNNTAKYAGFLCLFIGIPLFFEIQYVLDLWLVEVPEHTVTFARVVLLQSYMSALCFSVSRVVMASGKIRNINIIYTSVHIISLLLTFVLLKFGINTDIVIYTLLFPQVISYISYLYFIYIYTRYPIMSYIKEVIFRNAIVIIVACIPLFIVRYIMEPSFIRLIIVVMISSVISCTIIYKWGIDLSTRKIILAKVKQIIKSF